MFSKLVGAKPDNGCKDKIKPKIPHKATPFAKKSVRQWPEQFFRELKQSHNVNSVSCSDIMLPLILRFSKWYRLQVAMAWLLRYKSYLRELVRKSSNRYHRDPLKLFKIQASTEEIIRLVPGEVFTKDLELIKTGEAEKLNKVVHRYLSPQRKLNSTLIDVGGRLDKDPVSYDARHPRILPGKHHVTAFIIKHHFMEDHVGCSHVLATIRQKFWILQGPAA